MLRVIWVVVSIGLADSVNPTSIGPALYLASEQRPCRAVLQFTAGYVAVMLVAGLVLTLGPGHAILALVPKPDATTRYTLETIAGAAILITAAFLWWRRDSLASRESAAESHPQRRPRAMGAWISAAELPTAFPYFAAIAAVVGSGVAVEEQVLLVALYNLCFAWPRLAIAAGIAIAGDSALARLRHARAWLRRRWPVLVAVAALLAGLFVLTLGITGLEFHAHGAVGSISRHLRGVISH
jgi:cytochrome c biogenesis protein CcdA